jgi:hypothetical protein
MMLRAEGEKRMATTFLDFSAALATHMTLSERVRKW